MQTTSKQMRRLSASSVVIVAATVIALGALDMGLERARFLSPTFLLVYFGQYLMCRALGVSAFIGPMESKRAGDYSLRWIADAVGILGYLFTVALIVFVRWRAKYKAPKCILSQHARFPRLQRSAGR